MSDSTRTHRASIVVAAPASTVFEVVSDVTRTGEWSPICRGCEWADGDVPRPGEAPRVGARFVGHNVKGERSWDTVSTVTASDPGRTFAWEVGEGYVAWSYELAPHGSPAAPGTGEPGTELTQTWEFRPAGIAVFEQRYGSRAAEEIADRTADALRSIPATLEALRRIVESG